MPNQPMLIHGGLRTNAGNVWIEEMIKWYTLRTEAGVKERIFEWDLTKWYRGVHDRVVTHHTGQIKA